MVKMQKSYSTHIIGIMFSSHAAEDSISRWLKLDRSEKSAAEIEVLQAMKAVVRVCSSSSAVSLTQKEVVDVGRLVFRNRRAGEVLLSHMLQRNGWKCSDDMFYMQEVPWATGHVTFADVMKVCSIHSVFKDAADPLFTETQHLVRHLTRANISSGEVIKVIVILTFSTSTALASHFTQCFQRSKTCVLESWLRSFSEQLCKQGYKSLRAGQAGGPQRNRLQSVSTVEDLMSLLLRLDRSVSKESQHVSAYDLECVRSPLMLPHITATLDMLGFLDHNVPAAVLSSTNVHTCYDIFVKDHYAQRASALVRLGDIVELLCCFVFFCGCWLFCITR